MLKFTDLNQEYPDKRLSKDRKKDFREIYDNFIKNSAKEQSSSALNVAFHIAQFTVHFITIYLIG